MKEIYPNYEYRKVLGDIDHKYGIDVEVLKEGKLFLGLQIKPKSYLSKAAYIVKAQNANGKKKPKIFRRLWRQSNKCYFQYER
ncbi:hypothetical protein [Empedobacter stercoris]|uniref:DUF4365 domain-containing protein n=1 Tax=Empedobacter stercoris TaxID=1628248 RepID=A0ABX1WLA2_9FLAO|nr:hypothetical protein [Empedobacter stercoris]NOJ75472.1 hypothetical protein [Empedobacter stercoris]